jgi:hypothetical protein
MSIGRVDWRVRRPFGHIEIELYPSSIDAEEREPSIQELRALVWDSRSRQPEARRVVVEIYTRLRGQDPGNSPTDAVGDEILLAARAGLIVARRLERRSVTVPVAPASTPELGPDSSQESAVTSKTWVGIVLVDQDGTPVPNRPYRIIPPDGTTRDGTLDSHGSAMVQGLDPGNCQIWCPYLAPQPQVTYTVQDGDHTSGVAETYGFDDYTVVWNDPANADLQNLRPDPHVLQPGDSLTIPEIKAAPAANKPTGAKHQFSITVSPLKVRVTLLDLAAKPLAGAAVTVAGNQLTADGTGLVEATIDKSTQSVTLQAPDTTFTLDVGAINPSDDTSDAGYKARLFNLGFLWDPKVGDTDDEMIIALQDFQAQYSLTISGQLDDATKAQLSQSYGS